MGLLELETNGSELYSKGIEKPLLLNIGVFGGRALLCR